MWLENCWRLHPWRGESVCKCLKRWRSLFAKLDISHEASGLKPLWIRQYYAKRIKRIPGLDVVPVNRYHIGKPWKRWKFSIRVAVFCMFFGGWLFGLFHHSIWAKHRLRRKCVPLATRPKDHCRRRVACFTRLTWFLVEIWGLLDITSWGRTENDGTNQSCCFFLGGTPSSQNHDFTVGKGTTWSRNFWGVDCSDSTVDSHDMWVWYRGKSLHL